MTDVTGSSAPSPTRVIPLHRWCMALTLMLFNLADVVINHAITRAGGTQSNPVLRSVIPDVSSQLVVKTLVALAVCVLLLAVPSTSKRFVRAVGLVIVLYVVVMGWNIGILLQTLPHRVG